MPTYVAEFLLAGNMISLPVIGGRQGFHHSMLGFKKYQNINIENSLILNPLPPSICMPPLQCKANLGVCYLILKLELSF